MLRIVLLLLALQTSAAMSTPEVKEDTKKIEFTGYDCHQAQTKRMMQPQLCTPSAPSIPSSPKVTDFDMFQKQSSSHLTGISCEVKLTEVTGRC